MVILARLLMVCSISLEEAALTDLTSMMLMLSGYTVCAKHGAEEGTSFFPACKMDESSVSDAVLIPSHPLFSP
jgi:hypothetical protein